MTIIVGVLCEDGAVIGSDGLMSSGNMFGAENLKVNMIADKIIVACSGHDDLMTKFINFLRTSLSDLYQNESDHPNSDHFVYSLLGKFQQYVFDLHKVFPQGESAAKSLIKRFEDNHDFQALLAFQFQNKHYLYTINGLTPAMVRNDTIGCWYTIIGSGYYSGHAALPLISKLLNIKRLPTVNQAVILVYWTIAHVIDISSNGIGGNITVAKICFQEKLDKYVIAVDDACGAQEHINNMMEYLQEFNNTKIEKAKLAPVHLKSIK